MNRNAIRIPARPVADQAVRAARRLVLLTGRLLATLRSTRPKVSGQRLGAHLQADIGKRDTRLTRHEAAESTRRASQLPDPGDVIRHRIWSDIDS